MREHGGINMAKKRPKKSLGNDIERGVERGIEKGIERTIKNKFKSKKESCCETKSKSGWSGGFGYCLGFIGALVYYISTAQSFWWGVWGVIKALLWPAFLVYELLKYLGM